MEFVNESNHGAYFSKDREYRYTLWRRWNDRPLVLFIGLNPSTADESENDPTIRRCIGFAKKWRCGGIVVANLFAYRATYVTDLLAAADPIGPQNDEILRQLANAYSTRIACWGNHGAHQERNRNVLQMLPTLGCFGLTDRGHPKHPLYLPQSTRRRPFRSVSD